MSGDLIIPAQVPNGMNAVIAAYGNPRPSFDEHGVCVVDPSWERKYTKIVQHAIIPSGRLEVNVVCADLFMLVFDDWAELLQEEEDVDGFHVKTLGCFSPRLQ